MKHYDLSDHEKDMLKVIKHNQQISLANEEATKELGERYDSSAAKHEEMLKKVSNYIDVPNIETIPTTSVLIPPKSQTQPAAWDVLLSEANAAIPDDIGFEDILSSDEFADALSKADAINEKFSRATALKGMDLAFLFTATALQCLRQYIIGPWLKERRASAGADDEKGRKGNAEPGWYYVETDKILTNKVPFDTTRYGDADTIQKFLKGGDHRQMTLGHDPLLGWVFGTANILTGTLTRSDLVSAHVKYAAGKGNVIHSLASTGKIFDAFGDRLFKQGWDGKLAVGSGIVREALHLKSDVNTKRSLPIPIVSSISPDFANTIARHGIDTASVGTEMGLSILINTLIAMIHKMFYDHSIDDSKLYEVRTRKVLLYSNLIASSSNVVATLITKNPKMLDVGGLLVTISRLFADVRFILKVKQDFINSELDMQFRGIADEIEKMYVEKMGNSSV